MTSGTFDITQSPPVPERTELNAFYWDAVDAKQLALLRAPTT